MARSKVLPVPYFTQSTETNCQGTVLKMMASYLDALSGVSGAGGNSATAIKDSVNSGKGPSKLKNAHANFKWWLEQNYPNLVFEYTSTKLDFEAIDKVVYHINRGYPVLMPGNGLPRMDAPWREITSAPPPPPSPSSSPAARQSPSS